MPLDQSSSPPMRRAVAIHEASHAIAGLCLGRRGQLKLVSIVENLQWKGGCKWAPVHTDKPTPESDEDIAVSLAGPIGQVLYAPESLVPDLEIFAVTILQPKDVLKNNAGAFGWIESDLQSFHFYSQKRFLTNDFYDIEKLTKQLLLRPGIASAIKRLADALLIRGEITGSEVENLTAGCLKDEDFVGTEYFSVLNRKSPPPSVAKC